MLFSSMLWDAQQERVHDKQHMICKALTSQGITGEEVKCLLFQTVCRPIFIESSQQDISLTPLLFSFMLHVPSVEKCDCQAAYVIDVET